MSNNKKEKKQQCSDLSATLIGEFVRIFNSSKLHIYFFIRFFNNYQEKIDVI